MFLHFGLCPPPVPVSHFVVTICMGRCVWLGLARAPQTPALQRANLALRIGGLPPPLRLFVRLLLPLLLPLLPPLLALLLLLANPGGVADAWPIFLVYTRKHLVPPPSRNSARAPQGALAGGRCITPSEGKRWGPDNPRLLGVVIEGSVLGGARVGSVGIARCWIQTAGIAAAPGILVPRGAHCGTRNHCR